MGATPGLTKELAEEYGPNVSVTEDQTVGTSKASPDTANSQEEVTPPATAEGETPAAGASSVEGTPEESQQVSTETSEEETSEEDSTQATAEEITPEAAQALKEWGAGLVEEAVTKVREEEIPNVQRGLDSRITVLMEENKSMQSELDEATTKIRDASIEGLTPEEQAKMREGWANEDKSKGLDRYAGELDDMYASVMAVQLFNTYGTYGVTVAELEALEVPEGSDPVSVMTDFCKDKQIASQEERIKNGTVTTKQAPAAAAQPASSEASQPPPAGFKAPSDAGGSGVPPAPVERDEGKGEGAMGNNIAQNGWEDASFAKVGQ